MMDDTRAELADIYFESGSVQFGAFRLAAHQKDPNLPLSPIYLHYPKTGEGIELLPRLYALVGQLFYELVQERELTFDRIGAVPKGANPLAKDLAQRFAGWPVNLLEFGKDEVDGQNRFFLVAGYREIGETMLGVEDHTSGGYNKGKFIQGVNEAALRLLDFLSVVDREQGAEGYLASIGVGFHSIFKVTRMLERYVNTGCITVAKADEVQEYIASNQLWTPAV